MTTFKRRGTGIISGVLAFVAAVIVGISVGNDYWITAELVRNVQVSSQNFSSSSVDGGVKYFGLFHGCETKKWGRYTGDREKCFDVTDDLSNVIDLEYFYVTLGFLCASVLFLLIAAVLGVWNEFTTPYQWIFNSPGIYLSNGVAFVFLLTSLSVFGGLYESKLKSNVLVPEDKQDGFTTNAPTTLGYCYWILVASTVITIINIVLTVINKARLRHEFNTTHKLPVATNVDGMMLY